jgi:hypothetical protein
MSQGSFTLQVPHICGEYIEVSVKWWYTPGSYYEPPDGDSEYQHSERCPKCGTLLETDDLFYATIERMDQETMARGEPDEDLDYDPFADELDAYDFGKTDE